MLHVAVITLLLVLPVLGLTVGKLLGKQGLVAIFSFSCYVMRSLLHISLSLGPLNISNSWYCSPTMTRVCTLIFLLRFHTTLVK
jgi:hypothetical protein